MSCVKSTRETEASFHDHPPASRRSAGPVPLYQSVAIDTETLGLNPHRDRLCVVQISTGDGTADVVQIPQGGPEPAVLKRVLADPDVPKIFHFARFDVAVLYKAFGVMPPPVYCTKIASKLARTYTDRHGLKDVVREMRRRRPVEAAAILRLGRREPVSGAARLRGLRRAPPPRGRARRLDAMLAREGRTDLAACLLRLPADPRAARPRRLARATSSRIRKQRENASGRPCRPVSVTLMARVFATRPCEAPFRMRTGLRVRAASPDNPG